MATVEVQRGFFVVHPASFSSRVPAAEFPFLKVSKSYSFVYLAVDPPPASSSDGGGAAPTPSPSVGPPPPIVVGVP